MDSWSLEGRIRYTYRQFGLMTAFLTAPVHDRTFAPGFGTGNQPERQESAVRDRTALLKYRVRVQRVHVMNCTKAGAFTMKGDRKRKAEPRQLFIVDRIRPHVSCHTPRPFGPGWFFLCMRQDVSAENVAHLPLSFPGLIDRKHRRQTVVAVQHFCDLCRQRRKGQPAAEKSVQPAG